jgi:hypothetical protein
MSVERIIGIDFGTSTSVVKIKSYKDNVPLELKEMADYVRFDNKDSLPTLIYKSNEDSYLVGYEAANEASKGKLFQNFKLDLVSDDEQLRTQAIELTKIFFKYLYKAYSEQSAYFPNCDKETIYISYPAKWPKELINLMIDITKQAGFKNVVGVDEPTAAMYAVMILEIEKLQSSGLVKYGDTANILMIDMGAGTTDLVLCRYKFDNLHKIEILNTWPQSGNNILFGGREIDEILCEYIKKYLIECGLPNTKKFNEKYMDKCKAWKENNLSPQFRSIHGVVKYCGFIDTLLGMLDIDNEFPPMSRSDFETLISSHLEQFPMLINGCLENAKEKHNFNNEDLDFIILTGGHSQWYFVNDIINGSMKKYGTVNLTKIQKQPERVIKLSRPQETVALGLVYQKLAVTVGKLFGTCKAANLNNVGYAVYSDGFIYYKSIWFKNVTRIDGRKRTKVVEDVFGGFDVSDGWIYYSGDSNKIFKIRTDGTEKKLLYTGKDNSYGYINVVDGWIYFRHFTHSNASDELYRMRTDGSKVTKIDIGKSNYLNIVDDWIYYRNDDDNGKLYKMRTDGSKVIRLYSTPCSYINVVDDWIYCTMYEFIYRMRIDGREITRLNDESSKNINVAEGWIYYMQGDALYKIRTDGSEKTWLFNKCLFINVVGDWIYFYLLLEFIPILKMYRIRTDGTQNKPEIIL